ncbi:hypothetical protein [Algoriphagus yeomjeoni]|uniref:Uncharacterized protein n=1 Tax=Algoriphagus yeomjeoni TaxID=291403 RepID=A0A327PV14_9BACT|nr:hypothetical protein [Algoriphagus yeomjeoni]RAI94802.1 hypothetical protein LV83_00049 [Algoriphagus yeomjeoni]
MIWNLLLFFLLFVHLSAFSQSIYLDFDLDSEEKCFTSTTTNEKESYPKFSKRIESGNQFFRICSEEFIYQKGSYSEVKMRSDLKISTLSDLYVFESKSKKYGKINDSTVYIMMRNEIDSVFIAEGIDDKLVKIYTVEWIDKIE